MKNKKYLRPLVISFAACCITLCAKAQITNTCTMPALPQVNFKASVFLNASSIAALDSAVIIINKYPGCKIRVMGNTDNCELCQQVAWDRTTSVVKYLLKKGVDSARIIFDYSNQGNPRTVTLQGTSEDGPNAVPAPHPCYSYHKLTKKRCTDLDGHQKPTL